MIMEILTVVFYASLCFILICAFKRIKHMQNYRYLYNNNSQHNAMYDAQNGIDETWHKNNKIPISAYLEPVHNIYDYY